MTKQNKQGPKIVAIGGGHGLSAILRGLKLYTQNLTAIVTVADDGGGSGVLREDLGMPPPGDIRNCMEALANTEPVMEQLLSYRFTEGRLAGQAFGNLLLAALDGISDSFDQAVARMSDVLAITGRILPVTNTDITLEATFANGTSVRGESRIFNFKKAHIVLGNAVCVNDGVAGVRFADQRTFDIASELADKIRGHHIGVDAVESHGGCAAIL